MEEKIFQAVEKAVNNYINTIDEQALNQSLEKAQLPSKECLEENLYKAMQEGLKYVQSTLNGDFFMMPDEQFPTITFNALDYGQSFFNGYRIIEDKWFLLVHRWTQLGKKLLYNWADKNGYYCVKEEYSHRYILVKKDTQLPEYLDSLAPEQYELIQMIEKPKYYAEYRINTIINDIEEEMSWLIKTQQIDSEGRLFFKTQLLVLRDEIRNLGVDLKRKNFNELKDNILNSLKDKVFEKYGNDYNIELDTYGFRLSVK